MDTGVLDQAERANLETAERKQINSFCSPHLARNFLPAEIFQPATHNIALPYAVFSFYCCCFQVSSSATGLSPEHDRVCVAHGCGSHSSRNGSCHLCCTCGDKIWLVLIRFWSRERTGFYHSCPTEEVGAHLPPDPSQDRAGNHTPEVHQLQVTGSTCGTRCCSWISAVARGTQNLSALTSSFATRQTQHTTSITEVSPAIKPIQPAPWLWSPPHWWWWCVVPQSCSWWPYRANPCSPVDPTGCKPMLKEKPYLMDAGTIETLCKEGFSHNGYSWLGQEEGALLLSPADTQTQGHSWVLSSPSQSFVFALTAPDPFIFFCCYFQHPLLKKGHIAAQLAALESSDLHFWASLIHLPKACSVVLLTWGYQGKQAQK